MGRNTHTVVSVEANMAPATSFAPLMAASLASIPRFLSRYMFSITTIELSTSIPTPSARPESEMMFRVTPEKYMQTTAATRLTGIDIAMINVGLISRKKKMSTMIASNPPMRTFSKIVFMTRSI